MSLPDIQEDPWNFDGCRIGRCKLCKQELLLVEDDCWHPFDVKKACPEEPKRPRDLALWYQAGNRTLRPGRENWEPIPDGAFKINSKSHMPHHLFDIGSIVTINELKSAGLEPRIVEGAKTLQFFSRGFGGHEFKPPKKAA